jgi:hypothetical protein
VHTVTFDATSFARGVYLYRMIAGSYVDTRTLFVLPGGESVSGSSRPTRIASGS